MNIFEKLLAITAEMKPIEKSLNVGGKYHAVGEQDVLPMVRALEKKYKVYSYMVNQEIVDVDSYITQNQRGDEIHNRFLRIKVTYRFVNIEKPEEYVDTIAYGDGLDTADKAPGKAVTYAVKYALIKMYKMNTGEDPDMEESPSLEDDAQKVAPKPYAASDRELHSEANSEAPSPISEPIKGIVDENTGEVSEYALWADKLDIKLDRVAKAYGVSEVTEELLEKAVKRKASKLVGAPPEQITEELLEKAVKTLRYNTMKAKTDAKVNK